ncbi:MAG: isoleucine--tRNA ligase [Sphingomonas sp.]|uniref:isoleucine--tRNA ligase n=1 Tax=Sphingomonas sp. TaxID=28214 RepID=UPI0017BF79CB|nr:isoleucine--tRNA ligase [Sphingomonas sp.]MBA3666892.1 isoleucine--tRNA ligase [Sphingomonas sp.]
MSDAPAKPDASKPDWRSTVFLPKTDFPMKAGLPQKEPLILAKWQAADLYAQVRAARAGREKFILHDGPPYANGDIHIGHALDRTLKDMVVRTQTLLGKDAPFVPGWDCHGLPIEWKIEEQYRKKKLNKDEVPVKEFRAECRAYAQHWVDVQRDQLKRLGALADWDHPYLTMAYDSEATIVGELMKFAESGQVYRGAKPVMWSPVEKTALAEAEIEYEDIVSTQIDVAFEIVESPIPELVGAHAMVWTTTPWTIPVNQAIAYGPEVVYQFECFEFASGETQTLLYAGVLRAALLVRAGAVPGLKIKSSKILGHIKGADLAGTIARHPMHHLGGFFAKPRPFLPGEFVTTDTGTGLVHMSPDHGEDDFALCKAHGIDPVFAVEADGKYREDWEWLGGQGSVINNKFNAPDGPICSDLREAGGLLAASADYKHSYPHSWRSKAKVIYRCTPQWFIAMDAPLQTAGGSLETGPPLSPLPLREREGPDAKQREGEGVAKSPLAADAAGPSSQPSPSRGEGGGERALARWENEGGHLPPQSTLRQTALHAIANTRWVPEKGENRIRSMVEGRPDWVISRQRAWGVPIALFVEKGGNRPLVDDVVNARIVAAIKAEGVDAWSDERTQEYLGDAYDAADYERVTDILDVWFDSGCTHVFTLESGHWPEQRWPADLYLEGSDQHRGWFQSSLLESCGTRGRAPYDAVLTHGFTMDAKGLKMSKSVGNTITPLDLMRDYGADILRLWALSVDFTEDHRIGKEILAGVADQYRKLRNTFRYLLGALDGFDEAEKVAVEEMPELERYMLSLLEGLDERLRRAVENYDFNDYTRALADFCNEDLSAFYFDIRKDSLYCEVNPATGFQTDKRRAYHTVLDTLFHALVRWAAPVLVFTAEEVWGTRFPDAGSVHLLEWPEIGDWHDEEISRKWKALRDLRQFATFAIEPHRKDKILGSSLKAAIVLQIADFDPTVTEGIDLSELFICATASVEPSPTAQDHADVSIINSEKCDRCWRHLPEVVEDGDLCARCEAVVNG